MDPIYKCLIENKINLSDVDFITFRNNLNKIMATPWKNKDEWEVEVYKYEKTIFLGIVHLPQAEPESDIQKKATYWGYKFEDMCTREPKDVDVDVDRTPDPSDHFCSIILNQIGNNRIIMGAEMDCYEPDSQNSSKRNYIELKTSRVLNNWKTKNTFERYKLLSFWIQSYLAGVHKVRVGFRDDDGVVQEIRSLYTSDIPKSVGNKWEPSKCIIFLDEVLNFLKKNTKCNVRYKLQYKKPFEKVELVECVDQMPQMWVKDNIKEYLDK
eukprot:TRINITY_DN5560_c1_g3_i3.p1 TRINITY_DN5560_c1_g3~~TRINITY_DN5560_c1_g3_i3.p1  ORF type:complete len:268 (+),score=35.13 TRINITY_DN5560_c1_g3_i3:654-1457(+)